MEELVCPFIIEAAGLPSYHGPPGSFLIHDPDDSPSSSRMETRQQDKGAGNKEGNIEQDQDKTRHTSDWRNLPLVVGQILLTVYDDRALLRADIGAQPLPLYPKWTVHVRGDNAAGSVAQLHTAESPRNFKDGVEG